MTSSIDTLLLTFSPLNLPYSIAVIIAILINGLVIFLLMALFATVAVYFERKVSALIILLSVLLIIPNKFYL